MKKSLAEIPLPGKQRKGQCITSYNKSEVKKTFPPPPPFTNCKILFTKIFAITVGFFTVSLYGKFRIFAGKNNVSDVKKTLRKKAEREGFEPPEVLPSSVFKTGALNRSAISPCGLISRRKGKGIYRVCKFF